MSLLKKLQDRTNKSSAIIEKVKADDYVIAAADWEETDDLIEQIFDAIRKFGLFVYPLPSAKGTDTYGFIISKKRLSDKEIAEIDEGP